MTRRNPFAIVALLAALGLAGTARAGDDVPVPALERAERIEREGRALVERGDRVEGAKRISEAWAIRARAWNQEDGKARARRVGELRETSNALEREAHALRDAGKADAAEAKIAEAARVWKEAEALAANERVAKAEKERAAEKEKGAAKQAREAAERARHVVQFLAEKARGGVHAAELHAERAELHAKRKALEAEAADLWAAGHEAAAQEKMGLAVKLREKAKALELSVEHSRVHHLDPAVRAGRDALAEQVTALQRQVEELRGAIESLRKEMNAR
jgi:hypothetical protein